VPLGQIPPGQALGSIAPHTAPPQLTPDPYSSAVQTATQQFPWLKRMGVPVALTVGTGPYMSESYQPKAADNPKPGNFTIELRDKQTIKDPSVWPSLLGREGIDFVARNDPTYQAYAQQFQQIMTPRQLKQSRARYEKEKASAPNDSTFSSFDTFMKEAELQEYLGGYILDEPGWRDGWTPQQRKLLDGLKNYMWQGQKPTPVKIN
jgi:hypothetical protein